MHLHIDTAELLQEHSDDRCEQSIPATRDTEKLPESFVFFRLPLFLREKMVHEEHVACSLYLCIS